MKHFFNKIKGFTLVELVISVAIFAGMTALLLAKYGTFNQGILLTNMAYDVALTIRNAQSYGLNVKSAARDQNQFGYPYGVHFAMNSETFIFFNDTDNPSNFKYDGSLEDITITKMKRSVIVNALCLGTGPNDCGIQPTVLDVAFKRPNPDAIITGDTATQYSYGEIQIMGTDGSTRKIIVRSTGQIAVQN
jgi:prepilin-type N-terminal cleavage/methylation domain-containing protein